jgi:hypothetical protein
MYFSFIISETHKNFMLSNIVNQTKSWFTNIKELAESPINYNLLIEHSKSDSEDSLYFKQLLDGVKTSFQKCKLLTHFKICV